MLSEFPGVRYFPDLSYKIIVTIYLAFSGLSPFSVPQECFLQVRDNRLLKVMESSLAFPKPSKDDV